jgi:protein-disulfide isomerase
MKSYASLGAVFLALINVSVLAGAADTNPSQPVATIAGVTLTAGQMQEDLALPLYNQENQLYQMKQDWINRQAQDILFNKAAKAAGKSLKAWKAKELAVAPPTEAEIDAGLRTMVPANQIPTDPTQLKSMKEKVADYLLTQKRNQKQAEVFGQLTKANPVQSLLTPPAPPEIKVPKNAAVKGPANAPVVIFEFTDFECPWCKKSQENVKAMESLYGNQVQMVDRMFPLTSIHPRAMPSAEAAYCAKDQGKYWEFRDKLFESSPNLADSDFKRIAKELGLKESKFNACMKDHTHKAAIEAEMVEAQAWGVRGTPAFYVNGTVTNFQQLGDAVKTALDKSKK